MIPNKAKWRIVEVPLPDSGNRYLSKLFDDNWMRENGFMPADRSTRTVADMLNNYQRFSLVTAHPDDRMTAVVATMKEYDISQVPVVSPQGKLVGIVTEVDLLDHLLHGGHEHDSIETVAPIVNSNVLTVSPDTSVETVLNAFEHGKMIVVIEQGQPVGILTKIDLIDYVAGQIR